MKIRRPTKYECPLCGTVLTKGHYHKVIKFQEQQHKAQTGELANLKKQLTAAAQREKDVKENAQQAADEAARRAALAERARSQRLMKGQNAKVKKLQDRIQMLEQGTTPQGIGLADEPVLVAKLRKEFPDDRIKHAGKGGDVLHFVMLKSKEAGCIVYECKHTDRISGKHIVQTALAKDSRRADYAILVTTGTRRGFGGLHHESGIFIVAQAGVLTLARLCRESLVMMAKQELDVAARHAAARKLMEYITSPTCKNSLEQAITCTERVQKQLLQEVKQHVRDWNDRHSIYQTVHYDLSHIQTNIARVLDGAEPLELDRPKAKRLALPAPVGI